MAALPPCTSLCALVSDHRSATQFPVSKCFRPTTRQSEVTRSFQEDARYTLCKSTMHKTFAKIAYATAAVTASLFTLEFEGFWLLPAWLIVCAGPLLFTFAYPRFLFDSVSSRRPKYALVHHVAGAILSTAIFTFLSPHWKNPLLERFGRRGGRRARRNLHFLDCCSASPPQKKPQSVVAGVGSILAVLAC